MIVELKAAKKALAVTLALSLLLPATGFAQVIRVAPLAAPVSSPAFVPAAPGASASARMTAAAAAMSVPQLGAPSSPAAPSARASKAAAAPAAAAKSRTASRAQGDIIAFAEAVANADQAGSRSARVFDNGRVLEDDGEAESAAEESSEDLPAEAAALHKKFEERSAKRVAAVMEMAAKVKFGRFGILLQPQSTADRIAVAMAFVVDGKPMSLRQVEAKVAAGEIPAAEWAAAKPELMEAGKTLATKLLAVIEANETAHQAFHRMLDKQARARELKSVKATLAKGSDLQSWGLPISVPVDLKAHMRYAKLYRLNGTPTDLGEALHDLIAPLIAADPALASKLTANQLSDALQYLSDSLRYSLDTASEDGRKRARLRGMREGYDYPEARKALVDLARRAILRAPEEEDKPAGLSPVPSERHVTAVVQNMLQESVAELKRLIGVQAPQETYAPLAKLIGALHSATGAPLQTSRGVGLIPVKHRSLLPILAELKRRRVDESVVASVIRSFPLGESLFRLGIHKLWEQGLTGKGVIVAVLDNGVDFDHPDYDDVKNHSENMTRDRGIHTKGQHGTPMADIIHAIAPEAEIHSYQVLSNVDLPGVRLGEEEINAALFKGMDRAVENGAKIINMSLGSPMAYSNDSMSKKIAELAQKGILVVVSAGNSGQDLPKGWQIGSPASAPDAISVGAVDYHGRAADFSSEGVVFNPTEGTAAEYPVIHAFGVNVKAAMQLPKEFYRQELAPYANGSGTSPAAPHVSGVLTLAVQAAQEAGSAVAGPLVVPAAKDALLAGAKRLDRLPVLLNALAAVKAFVARLAAAV